MELLNLKKSIEKFIITIVCSFIIMGIEELKELLDVEDTIKKFGRFSPVYFFVYLAYLNPTKSNFIWLVISLVLTIGLPHFKSNFLEFFDKKGGAKFSRMIKTKKKRILMVLLSFGWLYAFILFYAGYLSVLQIIDMINNKNSDWIMIILILFVFGTILNLVINFGKGFKKEFRKSKRTLRPYIKKLIKKSFGI